MQKITVYTDGGCSGNPGPGAWAYIILDGKHHTREYGTAPDTTNNRMELTAVISAIDFILSHPGWKGRMIDIYTDSQYVKKGITSWIFTWEKNGWLTSAKKPVKNREYWIRLKQGADRLLINWNWVLGHAGNQYNEACDKLVQQGIKELRQGENSIPGS